MFQSCFMFLHIPLAQFARSGSRLDGRCHDTAIALADTRPVPDVSTSAVPSPFWRTFFVFVAFYFFRSSIHFITRYYSDICIYIYMCVCVRVSVSVCVYYICM